ncbi:hypothetical protein N1027_05525 [Herbiconiux sp. CPCC 205763]|uniref:FIMAH domain-containing protein n=1 Tax=Herbiconiux aconitum TaxID=2970913 RepID=A0ABT2GMY8_9MICO|nr:hypothetical protein [Herbiconiux aconitum]MCS5717595.1 hypothetical protein [Herbiconiux aconitum]
MRRPLRRLLAPALLAAVLVLTGCSGATNGLTAEVGKQLQSTVVTAADQAAAGDTAGALTTLDTLQTQLQQATDSGDISAERAATVQASIDLVRADLQPAAPVEYPATPVTQDPATTEPEPEPTEPEPEKEKKETPPGKDKDEDKDKGIGNEKNK